MNEAKCCASVEMLNDIAQDIIERLDGINRSANVLEERMYGSTPQPACETKKAPTCLEERLRCIRVQVKEIGDTLESAQARV